MADASELTVAQAADEIGRGRLSPVELIESLLRRSRTLEPDLRVWVTLDERAAVADAERRAGEIESGDTSGKLHGIPVGVKDIYYTRGVRTTGCSPIYADFVPSHDSTAVALLRRAGAVIMGKTVTTEFACMDPPPTRNPWNPAHTPGGSSSGSAVGVAARLFPAALGSQTAGSVLRPASYNGVVGMKPTFGRISRYGVMPVAWSLDTMGFFTRSVEDTAILLQAMAGHDDRDPSSSDRPVPDYVAAAGSWESAPRIGLVRPFMERADDEVRAHTDGVVRRLAAAGATIEELGLSTDFNDLLDAHRVVMSVEAAAVHETDFSKRADDYGPKVRALIEAGMLMPAVAYAQAQRVRGAFQREMDAAARGFDVLLTPTTPSAAPRGLETTGDPMFQTPWTTSGLPALTFPSGLSRSGLPLGIQLAAARFAEERLLAAARWCEQVVDVALAPPVAA